VRTWLERLSGPSTWPATLFVRTAIVVLAASAAGAAFVSWTPPAGRPLAPAAGSTVRPAAVEALPAFRIDVAVDDIGQEEKPGFLEIVEAPDGSAEVASARASMKSRIAIEIHGASSVILPKKSYAIELRNDEGDERALPILGLPAHSDWVLHGCGRDDTCLRNALAYELARDSGAYAPRTRFIELYFHGRYHGVYLLVERIRRGAARVDLPKPARDSREGDISGGYIFKMDLAEGHPTDAVSRDWVSPASSIVYSYHYPRFDDMTAAQKTYLGTHVAEFEQMMMSRRWSDAAAGYHAWIDVASWVDSRCSRNCRTTSTPT
jgi:hypothetical protein